MFRGEVSHSDWNRALDGGVRLTLCDDVVLIAHRGVVGNVIAGRTDEGLVLIDTGDATNREATYQRLREWDSAPVHTIVYTHGHVDHIGGASIFDDEADREGWSRPTVIAHRAVPERFRRYQLTHGWNTAINARQFKDQARDFRFPTDFRFPDQLYHDKLELTVGGVSLELTHGKGETDDHTWVWWPDRDLVCSGDFVIWAAPNCGNPQKAQRYVAEWSDALRAMAAVSPKILAPGHGPPVFGTDRIESMLADTSAYLDDLHEQTLVAMNRGLALSEVLAEVQPDQELLGRPYLHPTYDDPEFVVRTLWRLYGGWYDGNPAHLRPPSDAALAGEVCDLAGGIDPLLQRAEELRQSGQLALASSLVETAVLARPESVSAHSLRARIYAQRASEERSLMARGIFSAAAADSRRSTGVS